VLFNIPDRRYKNIPAGAKNHELRGKKEGAPNQGPFYKPPSSST